MILFFVFAALALYETGRSGRSSSGGGRGRVGYSVSGSVDPSSAASFDHVTGRPPGHDPSGPGGGGIVFNPPGVGAGTSAGGGSAPTAGGGSGGSQAIFGAPTAGPIGGPVEGASAPPDLGAPGNPISGGSKIIQAPPGSNF